MKNAMHIFYSFLLGVIFCGEPSFSQKFTTVTGRLYDQVADQPLPYANIILLRQADKSLAEGTSSDTGGYFRLDHIEAGSYLLQVSMMGYTTISREVLLKEDVPFEAGVLLMQEQTTELKEVNISGFRSKGKTDQDKTVFYMTGKIYEASQSGADALRYIPGIRMDLLQNISLDGSRNILLLIDGRESEMSFVRQIDAHDIDRVEIMSTPPARYDAEVTGVINIILKKDKKPGLSGHILLDIPTTPQVMYARPSANLNFSFRNIHIYGSYSGEMICGDLYDHTTRTVAVKTKYDLYVRQKYISHQCDLGLDYFVTKKDQLRFRAYYNPGSASYSGSAVAQSEGDFAINSSSGYERSDRNRQTYYSVFYQHRFNEKGSELTLDIINTNLRSEQITDFTAVEIPGGSGTFQNKLEPGQNSLSVRIDGRLPLNKKLELGIGSRMKWQHMFDATNEFDYSDLVCAVYTTMGFTHEKYDWTIGIRVEDARSEFKDDFENHVLSVLPNVSLNFKLPAKQNIRFAAGKSVLRPNIFQLNPNVAIDDPFTVTFGNPGLDPECRISSSVEYSKRFETDYVSARLFYDRNESVINPLAIPGDSNIVEIQMQNLGRIDQYGVQLLGSLSLGKTVTISPGLRLYKRHTTGNDLAHQHEVADRKQWVFEPGISGIVSFRHDMVLSVLFQYTTPVNNIQNNSFSGPLYFVTFEKTFAKRLKTGIVWGLPLTGSFTYNGSEIENPGFSSYYKGTMDLPGILVNVTLSYRFGTGTKTDRINPSSEDLVPLLKKGF